MSLAERVLLALIQFLFDVLFDLLPVFLTDAPVFGLRYQFEIPR